jgi:HSP20 family protein
MFSLMPMRRAGNGNRELTRPVYPMGRFNNEFETMFNHLFAGWPRPFEGLAYPETKWGFEVEELEKEFVIRAEAPGFEGTDFEVFVSNNVLMLKAEHKMKTEGKREGVVCCERSFEREVTLPADIKPEKIEAFYKNSILEVHVPKSEETKARRVIVKT